MSMEERFLFFLHEGCGLLAFDSLGESETGFEEGDGFFESGGFFESTQEDRVSWDG